MPEDDVRQFFCCGLLSTDVLLFMSRACYAEEQQLVNTGNLLHKQSIHAKLHAGLWTLLPMSCVCQRL